MTIKALLFDFDGTLLDTNELIIQSFMHIFDEKFPGQYTKDDCIPLIGPSLRQTFESLTPNEVDEMIAKYREWNEAHHDELVKEYDGVVETLQQLHAMGIRLVIVSSKVHVNIVKGLHVLGVAELFEYIVGADDVEHVKPHPEPIEKALNYLQLSKDEVIMVGDNSHDIEGGQNAGVKTAGVSWTIRGKAYLQTFNPDYMLTTMPDIISIVRELNEEN